MTLPPSSPGSVPPVEPGPAERALRVAWEQRVRNPMELARAFAVPAYRASKLADILVAEGWMAPDTFEVTQAGRRRLLAAFPDLWPRLLRQGSLPF